MRVTPVRLSLLGGPSGSGKTVWLERNIRRGPFKNALTIAEAPDQGLALLKRLCAEPSGAPRHVVLQLDPLGEPARLVEAVGADPDLAGLVAVGETLIVLDASLGAAQLRAERLTRLQALAADCIILAKIDCCAEPLLKSLIASLRLLNPKAVLFGAVRGVERDLPSDYGVCPEIPLDLGEERDGFALTTAVVEIDATVSWSAFSLWLSALLHARGRDIVRLRACVAAPAGGVMLHGVSGEALVAEVVHDIKGGEKRGGRLVMMGRGLRAEDLALSLLAFARAQD